MKNRFTRKSLRRSTHAQRQDVADAAQMLQDIGRSLAAAGMSAEHIDDALVGSAEGIAVDGDRARLENDTQRLAFDAVRSCMKQCMN